MKIVIQDKNKDVLCSFTVIDGRILDKESCELISIVNNGDEDIKIIRILEVSND